ncbi:Uncharacterised protein [Streptococcus pneumoniae]|nr:Uncharacterised protein [Streptococcus pneumoniae]
MNAAIIPNNIGTTAPALAVEEGTKNASTIETSIAPMTIFLVLFPTTDNTNNANRLCKLVSCIAAAKNNAAATKATAEVEKPLNASVKALFVPNISLPLIMASPFLGLPSCSDKF